MGKIQDVYAGLWKGPTTAKCLQIVWEHHYTAGEHYANKNKMWKVHTVMLVSLGAEGVTGKKRHGFQRKQSAFCQSVSRAAVLLPRVLWV